jgi:hypothetical protein
MAMCITHEANWCCAQVIPARKTTLMLCVAPLGNYGNNLAFALEYLSENKKLKSSYLCD